MIKRERLEDLGRLYEKLETACDHPLFEEFEKFSKHMEIDEWLKSCSEAQKDIFFYDLRRWVVSLKDQLDECLSIARGNNDLNNSVD